MKKLLFPFSIIFYVILKVRAFLYRYGFLKSIRLSKPVVSIGNMTAGGTGKTPTVDAVMTQFDSRQLHYCVLSRGYGRASDLTLKVSKTTKISEVGDEPFWLFERHPKASILVSPHRALEAQKLEIAHDIYILDDGFQHFKIKKDLEIVLLDCTVPMSDYLLMPMGLGRNLFSEIRRADLLLLTKVNLTSKQKVEQLSLRVKEETDVLQIQCSLVLEACLKIGTREGIDFKSKKVFLVSGIANPSSFETLISQNGGQIVKHRRFKDHFSYKLETIHSFLDEARALDCKFILTTEKDGVKWQQLLRARPPVDSSSWEPGIGVVSTSMNFQPPLPDIYDMVLDKYR